MITTIHLPGVPALAVLRQTALDGISWRFERPEGMAAGGRTQRDKTFAVRLPCLPS